MIEKKLDSKRAKMMCHLKPFISERQLGSSRCSPSAGIHASHILYPMINRASDRKIRLKLRHLSRLRPQLNTMRSRRHVKLFEYQEAATVRR
jgi:hypothetical protein